MKKIVNKTELMKEIEKKYNTDIEEILRSEYVDNNASLESIKSLLGISHVTIIKWLTEAGIYSRKIKL